MEKIRLMLVENNKDFRDVLSKHFRGTNDITVVAESGDGIDAINAIESVEPDVVVLDMIIPHLDGIGVLEHIYNSTNVHKPKFIVISSFTQEIITQKVMSLGASYFMIKPFDVITLTERIKTIAAENKVFFINEEYSELESKATGTVGYASALKIYSGDDFLRNPLIEENSEKMLEIEVTKLMHDIGIPAHIKGYQYLRDSIILAINEQHVINAMTKVLYPHIAKKHQTTPSRVERAIRHAIEVAWNRGQVEIFNEVFGYSISTGKGKPTNGEFIAMIADRIRLKM